MANLTTEFSSWSTFEGLLDASDAYAKSPAYTTEVNNMGSLTAAMFNNYWYFYGDNSHLIANSWPLGFEVWGSGLTTNSLLISRANIVNSSNASELYLEGAFRYDANFNPYGNITYSSYSSHGTFLSWSRGNNSLNATTVVLTSWGSTLPTAQGAVTFSHTGISSTNVQTYTTTTTYTSSTFESSGHRASISGFSYTPPNSDLSTVDKLKSILAGNDSVSGSAGSQELRGSRATIRLMATPALI